MKAGLFKIIIIMLFVFVLLGNNVFAISEIFTTGDDFMADGRKDAGKTLDTKLLKENSSKLYNVLLGIGFGVVVIVGLILGIKYMTAGINEKVEVKQSLIPYLISSAVIFGSFGIWKLVVTILKGI